MESHSVPEPEAQRVYGDLTRIHRILGDTASLIAAVRRDPFPVKRILDIGCARGGVLRDIGKRLAVDLVGVDISPPASLDLPFPILRADAVLERLPEADIAFCMYLGHHLSESDLTKLIANVGRSCRRFILLDLVRHPLPLAMFRVFVAPFVSPITVADGGVSIRRSYTPRELGWIASKALAGTGAQFRHSVAPLYIRQTLDIAFRQS